MKGERLFERQPSTADHKNKSDNRNLIVGFIPMLARENNEFVRVTIEVTPRSMHRYSDH